MKKYIVLSTWLSISAVFFLHLFTNAQGRFLPDEIDPQRFIVKTKVFQESDFMKLSALAQSQIGNYRIEPVFPAHFINNNNTRKSNIDLRCFYMIVTDKIVNPNAISRLFSKLNNTAYIEPYIIPKTVFTPNDTRVSEQYALPIVKAFEAWNINKGDTNVSVAITDTGIDFTHPDLMTNLKINYNDPQNGLDDDGDGYIDNYRGWDTGENDNNPQKTGNHGVHVTGISSASTNNNLGIAGSGFNCKYIPVKISNQNNILTAAYQGIVYAVDVGADIVNCSWGSLSGGFFGRDIIDYAVSNNVLVVAACGNNSRDVLFYPAAYDGVLSVAASNNLDQKWPNSNFGYYVNITAPGANILSTWEFGIPDPYLSSSGTSMAAPLVAGAAALVKSHFPNYNAFQIKQQLIESADNFYNNNQAFSEKLGSGRLNLFRALNEEYVSLNVLKTFFVNETFSAYRQGDTIQFYCSFYNHLLPSPAMQVSVSALSNHIQIIQGNYQIPALPTQTLNENNNQIFKAIVNQTSDFNEMIYFKINVSGQGYNRNYYVSAIINKNFINISNNKLSTTVASNGRLGFDDENQILGLGFVTDDNKNLLYEGSVVFGIGPLEVSDAVRGDQTTELDFFNYVQVKRQEGPYIKAPVEVHTAYNDGWANAPLGIDIDEASYLDTAFNASNFFIKEYTIKNARKQQGLNQLRAGCFLDWDIKDYSKNQFKIISGIPVVYHVENTDTLMAAVSCVFPENPQQNMHILQNPAANSINMNDGFSTQEKWEVLTTSRLQTDQNAASDLSLMYGVNLGNLAVGETKKASFVWMYARSSAELLQTFNSAKSKYNQILTGLDFNSQTAVNVYPNPFINEISFQGIDLGEIEIYNQSGMLMFKGENNKIETVGWPKGLYFVRVTSSAKRHSFKIVKI